MGAATCAATIARAIDKELPCPPLLPRVEHFIVAPSTRSDAAGPRTRILDAVSDCLGISLVLAEKLISFGCCYYAPIHPNVDDGMNVSLH